MFLLNPFINSQPFDPNLTLALLHFDGTDGTQVFTDSSPYARTFTTTDAGTVLSNAVVKFGTTSLLSTSGIDGGIQTTFSSSLIGNSDFTAEGFFNQTSTVSQHRGLFCLNRDSSNLPLATLISDGTIYACIHLEGDVFQYIGHQTSVTPNVLHHYAVVRNEGEFAVYLDGVKSDTTINVGTTNIRDSISSTLSVSNSLTSVGDIGYGLNGYQDEFRLRKQAMYTSNFTPPSSPFTF